MRAGQPGIRAGVFQASQSASAGAVHDYFSVKWLPATGPTQSSASGQYLIMQANSKHWITYCMATCDELGTVASAEDARACCESHARAVLAAG